MNAINRQVITDAIRRSGDGVNPDQVISNLSFGFWSNMTDRAHERNVWIPYLYHAWPKGSKRADIHARVLSVCRLRNRIAHHGKLFNLKNHADGPEVVSITLFDLFTSLVPAVSAELWPGGLDEFLDTYVNPFNLSEFVPKN